MTTPGVSLAFVNLPARIDQGNSVFEAEGLEADSEKLRDQEAEQQSTFPGGWKQLDKGACGEDVGGVGDVRASERSV